MIYFKQTFYLHRNWKHCFQNRSH